MLASTQREDGDDVRHIWTGGCRVSLVSLLTIIFSITANVIFSQEWQAVHVKTWSS